MSAGLRVGIGRALLVVGAALLGFWIWSVVDAHLAQRRLAARLEALERERSARTAHAARAEARATGLVGRLEIPRIDLSVLVVEGTTSRALRRGVGHLERSAFPGESGNVGLAAHRDTYFSHLGEVEEGDRIRLRTPDGRFDYRVESIQIVPPKRGDLIAPTGTALLTLVTCYPFHWIGPAPMRYVIQARPLESGGAALGAPPPAEKLAARIPR